MPDTHATASPKTASSDARRIFAVIDGNSLMHRAFHAVPPTMNAPDGRPTNAVFGFLNMFLKMVDAFHPDGVAVAFDKGKPRVRMEMLPQYKAQRPPMDPDLRPQFPMIKELLVRLQIPVLEAEGWEGDDILGTLARAGEAAGCDMFLVTGDRDMYQLSTEHVKIVGTKKGLSDVQIMTPETVEDLYHGITPELVPDFYGLKGDTSDNIPGVPGIGPKKASALIAQYGSLDEVIAHADEVKGKMGENLRAHIDDALLSRRVATIQTNAPVELDFENTAFPAFDAAAVDEALGALGIMAMQNRFLGLIGGDAAPAQSSFEMPAALAADAGTGEGVEEALAELDRAIAAGEWVAAGPSMTTSRRARFLGSRIPCGSRRAARSSPSRSLRAHRAVRLARQRASIAPMASSRAFSSACSPRGAWHRPMSRRCCTSSRRSIPPNRSSWTRSWLIRGASSIPWSRHTCSIPCARPSRTPTSRTPISTRRFPSRAGRREPATPPRRQLPVPPLSPAPRSSRSRARWRRKAPRGVSRYRDAARTGPRRHGAHGHVRRSRPPW